jgi:hypothetical protein
MKRRREGREIKQNNEENEPNQMKSKERRWEGRGKARAKEGEREGGSI